MKTKIEKLTEEVANLEKELKKNWSHFNFTILEEKKKELRKLEWEMVKSNPGYGARKLQESIDEAFKGCPR